MFNLSRGLVFLACLVLCAPPLLAQDKFVVFGGYSYLRPPVSVEETYICPGSVCPVQPVPSPAFVTNNENLNGWELSASYRFLPFLGFRADFSGNYGSALSQSTNNAHQYTYLFGPEVSLPARVSPFAHALFGGSHQTVGAGTIAGGPLSNNTVLASSNSAFATAVGAGIDLKLIPHLWIRAIQIDYLLTRFGSATQNQPRVSAGLVLHL